MIQAVRQVKLLVQVVLPKSSFLVCSAWRYAKTCRNPLINGKAKRKRWRFLRGFFLKNTTCPLISG
ncbi:hypothetical protein COL22_26830 [Bacillus thuringiensis]|nr:hypothetical protein COL22_26830 [Bacillus thuringiensis]